jgi:hypothetical protein
MYSNPNRKSPIKSKVNTVSLVVLLYNIRYYCKMLNLTHSNLASTRHRVVLCKNYTTLVNIFWTSKEYSTVTYNMCTMYLYYQPSLFV